MLKVAGLTIGLTLLASIASAQNSHLDTSIRLVRWDSLFDADTVHFDFDSLATERAGDITSNSDSVEEPFYDILSDSEQGGGVLDSKAIAYVDLNHDGREDAVVTLYGGGSGAFATDVIFIQAEKGPRYVGCAGGPHFVDSLRGDTLEIITAHWLLDEPQCCAGAEDRQRIIGRGDTVEFLPLVVTPVKGSALSAVSLFYDALNNGGQYHYALNKGSNKRYAYDMLSDSYRISHPYAQWVRGFANTISVIGDVDENSPDSAVRVTITSQDKIQNRIVTKRYDGVWHMKFITNNLPDGDSKAKADWFLDRPEIHEVKE